jgi:hypothetical protein
MFRRARLMRQERLFQHTGWPGLRPAAALSVGAFGGSCRDITNCQSSTPGSTKMRMVSIIAATIISAAAGSALAATGLDAYVDKNGFIDVQELTCDQLANTYQEDADALANWYSGWYNGLAKKHYYHLSRVPGVEHQLIVYCKAHRDKKVIHGLDEVFKMDRDSH